MMVILTLPLKCSLLVLLLLVLFAPNVVAYAPENTVTTPQKNTAQVNKKTSVLKAVPVVCDFDKLRAFQSYDPATGKWSAIEGFETVDILEDAKVQREERYVYRSFWAYDVVTGCWHKVDILDHGYRLGKLTDAGKPEATIVPKKSSEFWKNWAWGVSVGAGPTWYQNKIDDCIVKERDGVFFLQTSKGEQDEKSYKINWFGAGYTACGAPEAASQGKLDIRTTGTRRNLTFKGTGLNIPLKLFTHYTLLKRLRVGAGCEFEINHLKELTLEGGASSLKLFNVQPGHEWFYNIAWFGLIGFKVFHEPHQDVIVDFQWGKNYNMGATLKHPFGGQNHLYSGWLLGAGVAYERKLTNHFRLLTRFSGKWKRHDDTPSSINAAGASIKLHQIALHLDLGIQVSLGRDTEVDASTQTPGLAHDSGATEDRTATQKNRRQQAVKTLRTTPKAKSGS